MRAQHERMGNRGKALLQPAAGEQCRQFAFRLPRRFGQRMLSGGGIPNCGRVLLQRLHCAAKRPLREQFFHIALAVNGEQPVRKDLVGEAANGCGESVEERCRLVAFPFNCRFGDVVVGFPALIEGGFHGKVEQGVGGDTVQIGPTYRTVGDLFVGMVVPVPGGNARIEAPACSLALVVQPPGKGSCPAKDVFDGAQGGCRVVVGNSTEFEEKRHGRQLTQGTALEPVRDSVEGAGQGVDFRSRGKLEPAAKDRFRITSHDRLHFLQTRPGARER